MISTCLGLKYSCCCHQNNGFWCFCFIQKDVKSESKDNFGEVTKTHHAIQYVLMLLTCRFDGCHTLFSSETMNS